MQNKNILFILIFSGILVSLIKWEWDLLYERAVVLNSTVPGHGKVTGCRFVAGDGRRYGSGGYKLVVRVPYGVDIVGNVRVSKEQCDLMSDSYVPVRLSPSNPAMNRINTLEQLWYPTLFVGLLCAAFSFALYRLAYVKRA